MTVGEIVWPLRPGPCDVRVIRGVRPGDPRPLYYVEDRKEGE